MTSAHYASRIAGLCRASVAKHFDAYDDIAWDDPNYQIDICDPRWERSSSDSLGKTSWYQSQPGAVRAQLGLHMIVNQLKLGVAFENVLSRGLLEFASALPNQSAEFRYAMHEVIEEGQHSMMFQEFINRSGLEAAGLRGLDLWSSHRVPKFGRKFPELFFLFVLAGETPIDSVQRDELGSGRELHPLLERIMRIHVTEEARHISFAHSFLRERVPQLGAIKMTTLRVRAPILFKMMGTQMLRPDKTIVSRYGIPAPVIREAYTDNAEHKAQLARRLAPVRRLCTDIGVASPGFVRLWRWLGIWTDDNAETGAPQTAGC